MIAAAAILTDLALSLAAVIGLAVVHRSVTASGPFEALNRRFLFGLRVTILLYLGRALMILTGSGLFGAMVLLAAALIPISVLMLAEGLLRRHAPGPVKWLVLVGTVIFVSLALLPSDWVEPVRIWVLMVFQLVVFLAVGVMILWRDKASLSTAENTAVGRLGLSLLVMVPLAASDFLTLQLGLPMQPSALAVLVLCRLALSLERDSAAHGATLMGLGMLTLLGGAATTLLALMTGAGGQGVVMIGAIILATLLLADILRAGFDLRESGPGGGLLAVFDAPEETLRATFLAHPLVRGGVLLTADDLPDLDPGILAPIFAACPVIRRAAPPVLAGTAADHLGHLLASGDVTHLVLVSRKPFTILALSLSTLSAGPRLEQELRVAQKLLVLHEGQHGTG